MYHIVSVKGHYEVYVNGSFLCTADTKAEAMEEISNWEEERIA